MAHFSSVKDKKGGPNFELNLVPFIDLMCVCITFLLITAVWTQLSMVKLATSVFGQNTEVTPPVLRKDFVPFRVDIKEDGYVLTFGEKSIQVPKIGGEYDEKGFEAQLRELKSQAPLKNDAVISIEDQLPYRLLVAGMDHVIEAGFKDVGIAMGEVR